jgi:thiamine pyrophosphate-dependent acetolactate synthase large subunit-like protein
MVHLGETQQFQGRFNTSLFRRKLNVAQIADAVGALSFVVEKPGDTERALAAALAAKRPAVIDARVDPAAVPPTGMRLATLEKFFSAPQ